MITAIDTAAAIEDLDEWLIARTLGGTSVEALFEGFCDQLSASVLVSKAFLTTRALVAATVLTWQRGEGSAFSCLARFNG